MPLPGDTKIGSYLAEQGFAWLPKYRPSLRLAKVVNAIGKLSELPGLGEPHQLKPVGKAESTPNLYSGNFGLAEFPMHTDMAHWVEPPRFMVLRCIKGDDSVGTRVVAVSRALEGLKQSTVTRATFKPRKRIGGRLTLLPFCRARQENLVYRWDELFLKPANSSAKEVASKLSDATSLAQSFALSSAGDTLVVDNWQTLHGRTSVPDSARNRVIERAYLDQIKS